MDEPILSLTLSSIPPLTLSLISSFIMERPTFLLLSLILASAGPQFSSSCWPGGQLAVEDVVGECDWVLCCCAFIQYDRHPGQHRSSQHPQCRPGDYALDSDCCGAADPRHQPAGRCWLAAVSLNKTQMRLLCLRFYTISASSVYLCNTLGAREEVRSCERVG